MYRITGSVRVLFTSVLLLLLAFSCKDNPVKPPDTPPTNCTYAPGNRNFTWRLDTIGWRGSWLPNVWVFSDTDAYVMGQLTLGNGKIVPGLHWNGKRWEEEIHGGIPEINHAPNNVVGDDIFMVSVGYYGFANKEYAGLAEFDNRVKKWQWYHFQTVGELKSVWTDGKGFFIAGGDNGMVYTKDGYTAPWIYQKAPTDYSLGRISGISKDEIYMMATRWTAGNLHAQGWRLLNGEWKKLFDTQDTSGMPIKRNYNDLMPFYLNAHRCIYSDSLKLWIIGQKSFLYEAKGQSVDFKRTSLALPFVWQREASIYMTTFSPNDQWILSEDFNFQHWNGQNFQRVIIPGLPTANVSICYQGTFRKSSTGTIFFPTNGVEPQIYMMAIGTPQ